ncbi:hypothetical protein RDWZM_002355 [Blomia tropicalis]|uniref:Receptor expression-enhancing protein n=1 Tax=Blomia tropicalis TaxID=40697 RepID=A0A9Q0RRN2_BLOTA|nr:hypothetical protein RDWZM_002355 [Blomia tropicalis]
MNTYFKLVDLLNRLIEKRVRPLNRYLVNFERQYGVPKIYLIHAFVTLTTGYVLFNNFAETIRYFLLYLYPAYQTLVAVQSNEQTKCAHWLKYWSVYGYLQIIEYIGDGLLGSIPLYSLAKIAIVIWCYAPIENNGSHLIYDYFLTPTVDLVQSSALDQIGSNAIDQLEKTFVPNKPKAVRKQVPAKKKKTNPDTMETIGDIMKVAAFVAPYAEALNSEKSGAYEETRDN